MRVGAALRDGIRRLREAGMDGAARDARLLMAACLETEPGRVTLMEEDPLEAEANAIFVAGIADRIARKPVSRIIGRRLFWGRSFIVTPDVLDPRPETETLIELALRAPFDSVLDLGTGSGCIVTTLLLERSGASGTGTDLSNAALEVAERNARALGIADRLELKESDWFAAVDGEFDLIVSNPPYITPSERSDLAPEVLGHDPELALFDADDGLGAYRRIAVGIGGHLVSGGRLLVEIGPSQGASVAALFEAAGLVGAAIHPDLDGRDRVVSARIP